VDGAPRRPDDLRRRHQRETGLPGRTEPDGLGVITLRLPPLQHGAVMAAIDATVMTTTKSAECASADASSPPGVVAEDGRPSLGRRRATALVGLVTGGGAKVSTVVIVQVRADGATLADGTPIAGTLAERLLPESFIRAMIHDAGSHPINDELQLKCHACHRRRHAKDRR
jgi:hypothetical protein